MACTEMTVADLIDLLSGCKRSAPVRQAMNPFFPMAHRLEQVVQATDETGQKVVYLAEGCDADTQLGHLPPEVAVLLAWLPRSSCPRATSAAPPSASSLASLWRRP